MNQMIRDNRFDNIKGLMIFLVLFCHFIEKMYASWQDDVITRYLYYFIYLFHMPVFIFISGYFSKKNDSERYYKNTIGNCLIPYILFNFIYCLIGSRGDIWGSLLGFTYPQWTLWFLLSLFLWRVLIKPVSMIKGAFYLSILLSLYVGFTKLGGFLALARTFSFLPYFLAGYLLPEQYVEKVRSMKKIYACFAFALAVVSLLVIQRLGVGISALYMSVPYNGMSGIASIGIRLLILLTGFLCIGGFISIISEKHSIVSIIGKNSILIYLVHSGIIRAIMKISAIKINNGLVSIAFAAVFSVTICLLFGNEPIAKAYRFIIGSISNVLLKRE
ncbi:MAG: acyltransferase family protein [Lachnospiraceae bacterium]|nr:acyltransferase family protein [Lachnospiraceae bacterium]